MKYITGIGEKIRVIELPDDAHAITPEEESILEQREQSRIQRENEYKEAQQKQELKLEKQSQIYNLKIKLSKTDYIAIKFAEGLISAEEYEETKTQRMQWRKEINDIEESLKIL